MIRFLILILVDTVFFACVVPADALRTPGSMVGVRSQRLISGRLPLHKGENLSSPTPDRFHRDISLGNVAHESFASSVLLSQSDSGDSFPEGGSADEKIDGVGILKSLIPPRLRVKTFETDQTQKEVDGDKKTEPSVPSSIIDVSSGDSRDDEDDDAEEQKQDDPVCKVVATADGKIPRSSASALSPACLSLLEKTESLYAARAQKVLSNLEYTRPKVVADTLAEISTPSGTLERSADIGVGKDRDTILEEEYEQGTQYNANEEEKLISILRQSLEDGGFKLMNQRDLDLCSALNTGYLLRLSLKPDVKELDPCIGEEFYPELFNGEEDSDDVVNQQKAMEKLIFDGRVLVFRRGYSQEKTTGQLLLPKLDYLQASIVQRSATIVTRKLWSLEENLNKVISQTLLKAQATTKKKLYVVAPKSKAVVDFAKSKIKKATNSTGEVGIKEKKVSQLSRYGGFSATGSLDLGDALSPFLLCEIDNGTPIEQDNTELFTCQYDEEKYGDSHGAPVRLLERVSIQNTVDFFATRGRRNLARNYLKSSTLKEPAYEEVVVVWRPLRKQKKRRQIKLPKWIYEAAQIFEMEDRLPQKVEPDFGPLPLEIKAFNDVPMANLNAVLPKTKLIIRPADAVVFDLVSVVSFLAVLGSVRFDSAKLDVIAIVSLTFLAVRTFFRYSNKYARYDLLVNKFLTSKISHRGAGALKYIVSEANSQRALRAVLTREWLLRDQVELSEALGRMDGVLKQGRDRVNSIIPDEARVDIDISMALDDLTDLGLVKDDQNGAKATIKGENEAQDSLQQLWNKIFSN